MVGAGAVTVVVAAGAVTVAAGAVTVAVGAGAGAGVGAAQATKLTTNNIAKGINNIFLLTNLPPCRLQNQITCNLARALHKNHPLLSGLAVIRSVLIITPKTLPCQGFIYIL